MYVAIASGLDVPGGAGPRVVGYTTVGRTGTTLPGGMQVDGEVETLYVLDDWRDRGVGRRLIRTGAAHLAAEGSRAAFLWVLRDNPSRWFYQRLGGRPVGEASTQVAGAGRPAARLHLEPDRAADRRLSRHLTFRRREDRVEVAARDVQDRCIAGDHQGGSCPVDEQ